MIRVCLARIPRALALASLLAAACGGAQTRSSADNKVKLEIVVHASEDTNDGRPLHAVVRAVDMETYLADSYESVAALVNHKDDSVLATFVVFPGREQTVVIEASPKTPVAVYFLFTRPEGAWKELVTLPLARKLERALSRNRIER